MPELLSIHGRCPRCSQVLTVPAGKLQSVFRCARCQYRVLGSALMEEARLTPPRLALPARGPVVRPFEEDPDDQHTRLHLPTSEAEEDLETVLPAQLIGDSPSMPPPRPSAAPAFTAPAASAAPLPSALLQRFDSGLDADDQQTRLHVAGSFDAPRPAERPPPKKHATLLGVPAPARLSRFGSEPEDPDDEATRFQLADELAEAPRALEPSRGQTSRGVPAAAPPLGGAAPLSRFDPAAEDGDDQNTRLQVPVNYEDNDLSAQLRSPVAPRLSLPIPEPIDVSSGDGFGRATLQFSSWIDDWLRERHAVLLGTLAAISAIIAPVFDVLLGSTQQGATVIAANLALFFLWALAFAWLGKLRNDASVWDYRVAFTRITTGVRLALADVQGFGALPQPLRWRVTAEVSGWVGIGGLALASSLTLTHLVWAWPAGTGLLFLWRLFAGSCIVLSVIAAREAWNVPAGVAPTPDVTAPAVALFPAVLDLSLPLSVPPTQTASPLLQLLEVLSQWDARVWPNQDSYLAVLERHLMRRMGWARIERERVLGQHRGEGVAHLMVDESLVIEVVRGFDAEIAERVTAKLRRYAKVWRGKPALIVVFDASRSELTNGKGTPLLEALHNSYPMLAVRMPSAA
ncbi:MAG TPA: hypothetical protein VMG12_45275 [Polyangiaceae bacterium]|nr:hypothetical protein [Polyangiaceae bacterium]